MLPSLAKWLPRLLLALVLFLIAVDIAPEVDDVIERRLNESRRLQLTVSEMPDEPHRGHLLFCSAFDEPSDVQAVGAQGGAQGVGGLDERSLQSWVADLLRRKGYDDFTISEVNQALEDHRIDGQGLQRITASNLDSAWNLINIGVPKGPAYVLAQQLSPGFTRRLSTGTSGCDESSTSGTSGCEAPERSMRESHMSHRAAQGCSKSSSGTRGCDDRPRSGTQGCSSQGTGTKGCETGSGSQGCHAHAARGCDSGVQGCHSGVCGCEEVTGLGDAFGMMLIMPLVMLVAVQAVVVPAVLIAALALPALLLTVAFLTGSFLVLVWSGVAALAWLGFATWYRHQRDQESLLAAESDAE